MANVLVNCYTCGGTGLVKAQPEEIKLGAPCLRCKGKGSLEMELFQGRVVSDEFELVALDAPAHRLYPEATITYQEFLDGKMPTMPLSEKENGEKFDRAKVERFLDGREPTAPSSPEYSVVRMEDWFLKGIV